MLTPSRCEAGRWQPLRLLGEGVELTLLVRDTGAPLEEVLELPRVKLGGEQLRGLKVRGLPPLALALALALASPTPSPNSSPTSSPSPNP